MKTINKLIETNEPFAIIQYFSNLVFSDNDDKVKEYEVLTLNKEKDINFRMLTRLELKQVKENLSKFEISDKGKYGKVYEFNNFKEYREKEGVLKNTNEYYND